MAIQRTKKIPDSWNVGVRGDAKAADDATDQKKADIEQPPKTLLEDPESMVHRLTEYMKLHGLSQVNIKLPDGAEISLVMHQQGFKIKQPQNLSPDEFFIDDDKTVKKKFDERLFKRPGQAK